MHKSAHPQATWLHCFAIILVVVSPPQQVQLAHILKWTWTLLIIQMFQDGLINASGFRVDVSDQNQKCTLQLSHCEGSWVAASLLKPRLPSTCAFMQSVMASRPERSQLSMHFTSYGLRIHPPLHLLQSVRFHLFYICYFYIYLFSHVRWFPVYACRDKYTAVLCEAELSCARVILPNDRCAPRSAGWIISQGQSCISIKILWPHNTLLLLLHQPVRQGEQSHSGNPLPLGLLILLKCIGSGNCVRLDWVSDREHDGMWRSLPSEPRPLD